MNFAGFLPLHTVLLQQLEVLQPGTGFRVITLRGASLRASTEVGDGDSDYYGHNSCRDPYIMSGSHCSHCAPGPEDCGLQGIACTYLTWGSAIRGQVPRGISACRYHFRLDNSVGRQ